MRIGYLMQAGVPEVRKPPYDGPANHVRQVCTELIKRGHCVCLMVFLDGQIWKSDDLELFEPVTVRWIDSGPIRWIESGVRRIQRMLRLPYLAFFESLHFALACCQELKGFDLFYERIGWVGYGGGLASRWMNIPLVLEENGNHLSVMEALGNAPKGIQRRISEALMDRAMRRAAHVIASGEGWRTHFIERYRVREDHVTTVENGTELVSLLSRKDLLSFGAPPNPQDDITLVYVGGFFPWHGVDNLLRALARARNQGVQAKLILIGSGVGKEQAGQLTEYLHLGKVVTYTGRLSPQQFAPILARADIGLSPYCGWKEFSGLKILDYKAAGLATIASGLDGKPPTVTHGRTGLIVPPCDEDTLCEAIVKLASDPGLRRKMGVAARIEAEEYHSWEATVRQLESLFEKVVKK
jgi:glycosyltransferase involved in cell wall biosynthesis